MAKVNEKQYFEKIGKDGVDFTLNKPFSDLENIGSLLSDMAAIFSLMPKRMLKIADLGCGSGWTSDFYARAGHEVVGIDISKAAIDAANDHFKRKNLKFLCSDFDKIPFKSEFDVAIFSDSLHHTDDEKKTLRSIYRILKQDGMIIICEPGRGHSKSPSSVEAMVEYGVSERDMPPKLSTKALKEAGFSNIKVLAHPSKIHRINYKQFSGKRKLLNTTLARSVFSFTFSSIVKNNHGIVIAYKQGQMLE